MDKTALHAFSSGLYVVSAQADGQVGACVVNTGMQLTSNPLQVQVVINKQNHTQQVVDEAGHFALSVIGRGADMLYMGRFGFRSSRDFQKFADIPCEHTVLGDPFTPLHSVAVLACRVVQRLDVGTHVLYVGEVQDAQVTGSEPPLTYDYYRTVIKGNTPPTASSYVG